MENYLKNEGFDPFQMCILTTLDRNGNTKQTPFLKTSLKNVHPQVGILELFLLFIQCHSFSFKLISYHLNGTTEDTSANVEDTNRLVTSSLQHD